MYTRSSISFTCASGLIVILKLIGSPKQIKPFSSKLGVTSIVAVMGISPSFTAVNSEILSVPLSDKPIAALLLVQSYVVIPPVFKVVNSIGPINSPFDTTISLTIST